MPVKGRSLNQLQEGIHPKIEIRNNSEINIEPQCFKINFGR
jgi:hypothetical protein